METQGIHILGSSPFSDQVKSYDHPSPSKVLYSIKPKTLANMFMSSDTTQIQPQRRHPPSSRCIPSPLVAVRSVWASNLNQEFYMIEKAIKENFTNITIDTEFKLAPSNINAANRHPRHQSPEERYSAIRLRTDNGSIRQLGLTISSDNGFAIVWEFNFGSFHSPAKIEQNDLINSYHFSDALLKSGLINRQNMTWIMFHGAYDVAYLIKLAISWRPLPDSLKEFESLVKNYFGENIFDIKYMIKFTNNLFGGLREVAGQLKVKRLVGEAHQAGSDSLLTWHAYKKLKELYFPHDNIMRHAGFLYGIHDV